MQAYKSELGKPYQRITLFVCATCDYFNYKVKGLVESIDDATESYTDDFSTTIADINKCHDEPESKRFYLDTGSVSTSTVTRSSASTTTALAAQPAVSNETGNFDDVNVGSTSCKPPDSAYCNIPTGMALIVNIILKVRQVHSTLFTCSIEW